MNNVIGGAIAVVVFALLGFRTGYMCGRRDVIERGITRDEFKTLVEGKGFPKSRV